jgi:ABC-2 type transport system permease protein
VAGAPAGANAAAPARRVLAQGAFEARAVLGNGEQVLLVVVLPALVLLALTRSDVVAVATAGAPRIDVVTPGVLALAVMSTAFTSQAISTAFDRRSGVLRLLATTPLGRSGLLAGKVLAVLAVLLAQLALLGGLALGLGWAPVPAGVPLALLAVALATTAFVGLALLMAGTMRAEAVLAAANLVWVVLLVAGGVVVPAEQLPGPLSALAPLLPSGALAEALRVALGTGVAAAAAGPLLVLAAWAVGAALAARRWFRWS